MCFQRKTLPTLTQARLKAVLSYDRETGHFERVFGNGMKCPKGPITKDGQPGTIYSEGYRFIMIDRERIAAASLAWLYEYGCWPTNSLDHINGDRSDNRIANLREATPAENAQNSKMVNPSGFRVHRNGKKWGAQIKANGRRVWLGAFNTLEEASCAYLAARATAFHFQPIPRENITIGI